MIFLLLLIAGIVLEVLPPHFAGQHKLGLALIVVMAVLWAFFTIVGLLTARTVRKQFKRHDDLWDHRRFL